MSKKVRSHSLNKYSKNYDNLYQRHKDTSNNWNSTQEKLLAERGEQAKGLKWMHEKSSHSLYSTYNILGVLNIIFSSASGTGIFANFALNSTWVAILVGIMAYMAAILASIQKFLNLSKVSAEHKKISNQYQFLASEIEIQLALPRQDRLPGREYVETMQKKFNLLMTEAPEIPTTIVHLFEKRFGNRKIAKPDIANGIDPIQVRDKHGSPKDSPGGISGGSGSGSGSGDDVGVKGSPITAETAKNVLQAWRERSITSSSEIFNDEVKMEVKKRNSP